MKILRRTNIYESLFLINRGNDLMVQGMRNLGSNAHLLGRSYREAMLDLQHRRTVVNLQLLSEMQQREQGELDRLEQMMRSDAAKAEKESSTFDNAPLDARGKQEQPSRVDSSIALRASSSK